MERRGIVKGFVCMGKAARMRAAALQCTAVLEALHHLHYIPLLRTNPSVILSTLFWVLFGTFCL